MHPLRFISLSAGRRSIVKFSVMICGCAFLVCSDGLNAQPIEAGKYSEAEMAVHMRNEASVLSITVDGANGDNGGNGMKRGIQSTRMIPCGGVLRAVENPSSDKNVKRATLGDGAFIGCDTVEF